MGVTVRQKTKGRGRPYYIFVNQNRRIVSKCVGDRRAALAVASALRRKMKMGELNLTDLSAPKKPTFGEYVQRYLTEYAAVALKFNTYRSYIQINKCHLGSLHHIPIDRVSRADIKRILLQKQRDGLAASTVHNVRVFISGVFAHAIDEEIVTVNPGARLGKIVKKDDHRKHIRPLTCEQTTTFLQTVRADFREFYPLMLMAFRTGMRQGEIAGLAWGDVDLDGCSIIVSRSYSHAHWSSTKSHKSRTVDMSDQLRTVLLDYKERQVQRFRRAPVTKLPSGALIQLVFTDRDGGPMCMDNFRKRTFGKMIEAADVPKFRFHDCRHTFASMLLAQGESLAYVRDQLGHASIQTTVNTYCHLIPGSNRNAVNKLDDHDLPELQVVAG